MTFSHCIVAVQHQVAEFAMEFRPIPSGGAGCSECILRASHSGMAWGRMSFGDPGKNGKFFSKNGRLRQ